jgi:hypothetical protein
LTFGSKAGRKLQHFPRPTWWTTLIVLAAAFGPWWWFNYTWWVNIPVLLALTFIVDGSRELILRRSRRAAVEDGTPQN